MFHEGYAAGGFGILPRWQPDPVFVDKRGQWLWYDEGENLVVIQATGIRERSRSHPLTAGTRAARFRLGSAWDDVRDNQYVRIPRMRDLLVVILPDGRWQTFRLGAEKAAQVSRIALEELERDDLARDLLRSIRPSLDRAATARLEDFLKGYKPPE
jgi:hypothetical protein